MDRKTIRLALAITKFDVFESRNFCNAYKFRIYDLIDKDLVYVEDIFNKYRSAVDKQTGTQEDNSNAIIDLLKNHDINVLVSSVYGRNLQKVNNHFIPVVVTSETPDEVLTAIIKHIKWIEDELANRPAEFKLFTIKKGILKTSVKKDKSTMIEVE
jgi:predicted Fe-Mo cluster-binding NifX family protein